MSLHLRLRRRLLYLLWGRLVSLGERCDICGRRLDDPRDYDSLSCGGACWGCVREVEEEWCP